MSIGLYDVDMSLYSQTPFNLELMKYASYYKKKREIVSLSPSFSPNKYSTFIIRKDYQDGNFPINIGKYDNIIFGGHGFSGQNYIPLEEDIEKIKPDKSIYEKFRPVFGINKKYIAAFDVMMHAEHLRLSLDGINIWPDYRKTIDLATTTRTLFFHDYDINKIQGGREEVKKLLKSIERSEISGFLATKFPIKIYTLEDLIFWCSFKSTGSFFNVEFQGPLEDEELYNFIKTPNLRSNPSKIEYVVTTKFQDEKDFIIRGLPQIYNQVLFLRMSKTKILLKYEDNFFVDKRWERVIQLFNCFMSSTISLDQTHFLRVIDFDNMYSFVKSFDDVHRFEKYSLFNKQEARELFLLVQEANYPVFKAFYEGHKVELIGGKFQNDSE